MKSFVKKFTIKNKSIKLIFNLYSLFYEYAKIFSLEVGFYETEIFFTFLAYFTARWKLYNIIVYRETH